MTISHQALAERLRAAYLGPPIAPMRDGLEPTDEGGAYAVQALNTRFWVDQGRRIVGRKIGLTSKAVQQQLGVDQPDYGVLFADMAVADGGLLKAKGVLQPKVEVEVAFVMARDFAEVDATPHRFAQAVAFALPAIEIVDSRVADWKITFADTVADNGSSAFFVLGSEPRSLAGLDLRTCGMVMEINGATASMGVGAACLGHPLVAACWLAQTLAHAGEGLKAGDVVLSGALGPMVALNRGDVVHATVGGLGAVGFSYERIDA